MVQPSIDSVELGPIEPHSAWAYVVDQSILDPRTEAAELRVDLAHS